MRRATKLEGLGLRRFGGQAGFCQETVEAARAVLKPLELGSEQAGQLVEDHLRTTNQPITRVKESSKRLTQKSRQGFERAALRALRCNYPAQKFSLPANTNGIPMALVEE